MSLSFSLPQRHLSALTEVDSRLKAHCQQLENHPLFQMAQKQSIPRSVLNEFAYLQYVDSILWVPMLAMMKERVTNPRLTRAIVDNISCEAGLKGTSHIELARKFIHSLGLQSCEPHYETPDIVKNVSHWSSFSEPTIAGWLYGAESLVPILFQGMLPTYEAIPNVHMTYLKEHIGIDCDEHSKWMRESLSDLLVVSEDYLPEILLGIDLAARETHDVPDQLYAKALWLSRD